MLAVTSSVLDNIASLLELFRNLYNAEVRISIDRLSEVDKENLYELLRAFVEEFPLVISLQPTAVRLTYRREPLVEVEFSNREFPYLHFEVGPSMYRVGASLSPELIEELDRVLRECFGTRITRDDLYHRFMATKYAYGKNMYIDWAPIPINYDPQAREFIVKEILSRLQSYLSIFDRIVEKVLSELFKRRFRSRQ